jgi:3-deoxy-D-manno-octulosonic-acid transferase
LSDVPAQLFIQRFPRIRFMQHLYTLAWWLALPFAFLYLLWRARRQPDYLHHWAERLGGAPRLRGRPVIWVHAVSVGETRAAAPLIEALRARYPDHTLLLTHTTPTGRQTGASLFANRSWPFGHPSAMNGTLSPNPSPRGGGECRASSHAIPSPPTPPPEGEGGVARRSRDVDDRMLVQAYLPYDLPWCVRRFLDRTAPCLGVILETEIWPNLLRACEQQGVPVYLVNARLSERSARGYARLEPLTRASLGRFRGIAAQTAADAQRLQRLGARSVTVTGNLKFDVPLPADTQGRAARLRAAYGARFVFLAASTREGEEALLLEALAGLDLPDLLLVIVPRHPQRFEAVARLIAARGLQLVRRSEGRAVPPGASVFLGDSMGELAAYYAAADLAYVGGSLLPYGGQNLIEAAAAGVPVLIGPHTWNFAEAAEAAVACAAALRVQDVAGLRVALLALHADPERRRKMAAAGLAYAQSYRGATQRVMALLEVSLPPPRGDDGEVDPAAGVGRAGGVARR